MNDWPKDPVLRRRLRLALVAWLAVLVVAESIAYFFVDRAAIFLALLAICAVGVVVNGVMAIREAGEPQT